VKQKRNSTTHLEKAAGYARGRKLFRARDFEKAGFSREYLKRLARTGKVRRLGRGLYASTDFDADQNISLLEASRGVPRGVVCLGSALQFHQIGTQSPHQVWLAVPRGVNFPAPHARFRFCKFSEAAYSHGIEEHDLAGGAGAIRVYSPAKTVADCFKYRNKYGLDMAVEALREGWRGKRFSMRELLEAAEICRVRKVMQPCIEMLA